VEKVITTEIEFVIKMRAERESKESDGFSKLLKLSIETIKERFQELKDTVDDADKLKKIEEFEEDVLRIKRHRDNESYYPICDYSIISQLDESSDLTAIKAGIEICEDIMNQQEEEIKANNYDPTNVDFAKDFLKRFKNEIAKL
jgi:hypothetical protein